METGSETRGLSEAARRIFEHEVSATNLWDAARFYAIRRAPHERASAYAEDVVSGVLADTLSGVIAWDPARVTLRKHVLDAIQSRIRHDRVRRKRFVHESLSSPSVCHEVERMSGGRPTQQAPTRVVSWLREECAHDTNIMRILELFEEGVFAERRVLERLGIDKLEYRAARKRMRRLAEWMPAALKTSASDSTAA